MITRAPRRVHCSWGVWVVPWAGARREAALTLSALGCGVELVACEHLPLPASPLALHRSALDTVCAQRDDGASFRASAKRISADELFGWAYDRRGHRLLRVADDEHARAAQARRWEAGFAGYGPFRWVNGHDGPDGLVWVDDRCWSDWGFACLLLPPGVSDHDATRIEALVTLVDEVILGSPGDGAEAFRWELHAYDDDTTLLGYDAWTVRAASNRIVVVHGLAGTLS